MDISNDKQMKSHTRKIGHGSERETLRETESLLIAAQNNAMKTMSKQEKIRLQNRKSRLWGNRGETINHIISECSKLA